MKEFWKAHWFFMNKAAASRLKGNKDDARRLRANGTLVDQIARLAQPRSERARTKCTSSVDHVMPDKPLTRSWLDARYPEHCPDCDGKMSLRKKDGWTVGGLYLAFWNWCSRCRKWWLPTNDQLRSKKQGAVGAWTVAASGVSVNAGGIRIRLEGGTHEERMNLARRLVDFSRMRGEE